MKIIPRLFVLAGSDKLRTMIHRLYGIGFGNSQQSASRPELTQIERKDAATTAMQGPSVKAVGLDGSIFGEVPNDTMPQCRTGDSLLSAIINDGDLKKA